MKTITLFHTPASMDELQSNIESLSARERALVYPYVMMMYNLMVTIMNTPTEGMDSTDNS